MRSGMDIAFFGSSLVSAYWNGAATYYRGIIRALHGRGHRVTFYEPNAYGRQEHRDIADPDWAQVVVYSGETEDAALRAVEQAKGAEQDPLDPFRPLIPRYDLVLTYGGGDPVVRAYHSFGARECVPIYNALDPSTHHPVPPDPRFAGDLAFLGNRLPDREARVEEFFLAAATALPDKTFLLGGSGWGDKRLPPNVRYVGHVYTRDHNAFNCTPTAVLNVNRESMARYGFSPPTRVFEAAGAGACLITDHWEGIELFLEPDREVIVARSGLQVAQCLGGLSPARARELGRAAQQRILAEHTYDHRAAQVEELLDARRPAPGGVAG
jgi:spore maturation protein CgeB